MPEVRQSYAGADENARRLIRHTKRVTRRKFTPVTVALSPRPPAHPAGAGGSRVLRRLPAGLQVPDAVFVAFATGKVNFL